MRILLIDDSRTMRNIQKLVLRQAGYEDVVEAGDGNDALAKVPETKPDLILLDWNMPNMDGITFLRAYRAKFGRATPVIMVTTEMDKPKVLEAIKAGINNYVVKPFTPDLLRARITETLAKVKKAA